MKKVDNVPEKCFGCKYMGQDTHLEYFHYYICEKAHGKEISFGLENGWDRMKWCPLLSEEQKKAELVEKANKALEEIKPYMWYYSKRKENESHFNYLVSTLEDRLKDAVELICSAKNDADHNVILCSECKYWKDEEERDKHPSWLPCMAIETRHDFGCTDGRKNDD